MESIGKATPLSRNGTHNKYLKTLRYSPRGTVIDAVQPIRPAVNQLYDQKPSYLFNADVFNRHLGEFEEAYRRLQEQRRKYGGLKARYESDPDGVLNALRNIIKHFNQTTAVVLTFDRTFQTHHSEMLADLLGRQQFTLEVTGITIVGVNQLELDGARFRKSVRENSQFFMTALLPTVDFFEHIFTVIRHIEPPVSKSSDNR